MGWIIAGWWHSKSLPKVDPADKQAWLEANRTLSAAGEAVTVAQGRSLLRRFIYDAANYAGHMYDWAGREV